MSSADTQGFQTILEDAETFSPHTLLRYAVKFYLQKKKVKILVIWRCDGRTVF